MWFYSLQTSTCNLCNVIAYKNILDLCSNHSEIFSALIIGYHELPVVWRAQHQPGGPPCQTAAKHMSYESYVLTCSLHIMHCISTDTHTYIHTYLHTYIHTYIHTYTVYTYIIISIYTYMYVCVCVMIGVILSSSRTWVCTSVYMYVGPSVAAFFV